MKTGSEDTGTVAFLGNNHVLSIHCEVGLGETWGPVWRQGFCSHV